MALTPLILRIITSVPTGITSFVEDFADHFSPSTFICPKSVTGLISCITMPFFPIIEKALVTVLSFLLNFFTKGLVQHSNAVDDIVNIPI